MIDKRNKYLSVRTQCGLLDLNRSSLYYQQTPLAEDTEIANRIGEIYETTPQYGYRRIHAHLIREGVSVNRKKVQRLMTELGLKAIYPKPRTTIRGQQSKSYPYLLSGAPPSVASGYHLSEASWWICLFNCADRRV